MTEPTPTKLVEAEVSAAFREGARRAVATLARKFGDLSLAEECVQEAFVAACRVWPEQGIPPNPVAWVITTARNAGIDRLRREASRGARHQEAMDRVLADEPAEDGMWNDDQLRLIFTCCHPAIGQSAQVALTLRLIAGLQTDEIARAFLLPEPTLAQRIVRAKNKIAAANIPYRIPEPQDLPERITPVLQVIYLVFNEGYLASKGENLLRDELCTEAIRLSRLLVQLLPAEREAQGLLALLLLIHARRDARTAKDGSLVRLPEQDRSLWDREAIVEGQAIVLRCLRANEPGPYQVQAAIAAVHSDALDAKSTDWRQIVALYDLLVGFVPTAVVHLNRAIAVAEVEGPAAGLRLIEPLELSQYHLWHAARGEMLQRLGRFDDAIAAYDDAAKLTENDREQHLLMERRATCMQLRAGRSSPAN